MLESKHQEKSWGFLWWGRGRNGEDVPPLFHASHIGRNVWPSKGCACLRAEVSGLGIPDVEPDCQAQGQTARAALPWKACVLTLQVKPERILCGVENQTKARVNGAKLMIIEV